MFGILEDSMGKLRFDNCLQRIHQKHQPSESFTLDWILSGVSHFSLLKNGFKTEQRSSCLEPYLYAQKEPKQGN